MLATCGRVSADVLSQAGYDPDIALYCANNGSSATTGFFLEPRGNRRAPDDFYQIDLGITKAFQIKDFSIELIGSIVNVLSDELPTSYGTQEFFNWGQPLTYQQPRRYEVGVRFEF